MLIDARNYLDDDGWPVYPARDKLPPLPELLAQAALTARFTQREHAVPQHRQHYTERMELRSEREAVAYELTLPKEWHFAPIRRHVCQGKWGRGELEPD